MAYNQRTGQGSNYVLRTGLSSFNDLDATDITSGTFDAARLPSITKSKVSNTGTWESSEIPNLSATKITSDELDEARIPELSASKITSGTLAATHIPDLSATKITSDELDADRIPNLSATKITSGTLRATHIPDLSANKITADALHVDRIPNLDASKITSGVFDALRIPTTDLMGVSQVGSTDDYMPAHLFRAPNMYSFIDSGTTKTRLVFGCEDVVDSSSLQNPFLDSTRYPKCVCINIPQGWSATAVFISQWVLNRATGVVNPYIEPDTTQSVEIMELPRFHYSNVYTLSSGSVQTNYRLSYRNTTRSFTTNTDPSHPNTFHLNTTLTLATDTTQISLGPAGDLRQMIIKIGTPRNSFNYSLYLPGGYVELEEIS